MYTHMRPRPPFVDAGEEGSPSVPLFGSVVLDASEDFLRWRADVDAALRGLAAATNALAACSSGGGGGAGSGGSNVVSYP